MAQPLSTFDTAHTSALHDAQLDYYGKRLATASSDHCIRIWDVSTSRPSYLAELNGHNAPVWQVCWSHPKFGSLLASCSYDKKIIVWKEAQPNKWYIMFKGEEHTASVNSIAWAPWEMGLHLATASSDGAVCVWSYQPDHRWTKKRFIAHRNGVNGVSWSPSNVGVLSPFKMGEQVAEMHAHRDVSDVVSRSTDLQLVTGGCDNQVRVWRFEANTQDWREQYCMAEKPHTEWVRDVAWRPNVGLPTDTIASCSEDGNCIIWVRNGEQQWRNAQIIRFDSPVWRVAWSVTGTVLAIASGDNRITLFKETMEGVWEKVTHLSDNQTGDPAPTAGSAESIGGVPPYESEGPTELHPLKATGDRGVPYLAARDGIAPSMPPHTPPAYSMYTRNASGAASIERNAMQDYPANAPPATNPSISSSTHPPSHPPPVNGLNAFPQPPHAPPPQFASGVPPPPGNQSSYMRDSSYGFSPRPPATSVHPPPRNNYPPMIPEATAGARPPSQY